MNFTFLGTGSAFTTGNFHTNTLITSNHKRLLIDAGTDIRFSLANAKISHKDLDAVYVTHQHADHIGGLEWLAFITRFDPSFLEKLSLIGDGNLLRGLWEHSLRGGMESLPNESLTLSDYFDVHMVKKDGEFTWEGINFRIVRSDHIINESNVSSNVPSFGLMMHELSSNVKVYYTGDSRFGPYANMRIYEEADIIIQDCETYPHKSEAHANWIDLITLDRSIKNKMFLTHYQDNVLDDLAEISYVWKKKAEDEGFARFLAKGSSLKLKDMLEMARRP
jgi:ribonuclease BN (tRNA processing enzyme)